MAEIGTAEESGVEIVKMFPGETVGGPEFVKAILGPSPWTRIMPTGIADVSKERIDAWFKAGVACIGVGSKLIPGDIAKTQDYEGIRQKTAQMLGWIHEQKR
jgi:2-dehydro-3-deoxyphosphogluconate aldolase/(4S)-4-hydroxy-2-oxoglutarate aldolase